ncbi:unnamed protein product, partial [Mesorhabditis spiculigera]
MWRLLLILYAAAAGAQDSEAKEVSFNLTGLNVSVPRQTTTLWCHVQPMPEAIRMKRHQLVRLDPIITPGNEEFVHHFMIFSCLSEGAVPFSGECQDHSTLPEWVHRCRNSIAAWPAGAPPILMPDEAGLPLGENGHQHLMIEIHYHNPSQLPTQPDSSGMRVTATSRLRRYDAAVLQTGTMWSDAMSVPPKQEAFPLHGHCAPECTSFFPPEGIRVFASMLHAHKTTQAIWTSIFRDGQKIGELNRDDNFGAQGQHRDALEPPVVSDRLVTTCVHNTMKRVNMTHSGLGGHEEMCINYIHYYPRMEVAACQSQVTNASLQAFFERENVPRSAKSVAEQFAKIDWNGSTVARLQEYYETAPLRIHCLDELGKELIE